MKESFKPKMQENKPHLTFRNTKKKICLEKKREFFLTLTPIGQCSMNIYLINILSTFFFSLSIFGCNHLCDRWA